MSRPSLYDLVGRYRGECGICGGPDARHRVYDTIGERVIAGDSVESVADDYDLPLGNVVAIVRNMRMREIAAWALNRSRSRSGRETRITPEQYRDADAVILALFAAPSTTTNEGTEQ